MNYSEYKYLIYSDLYRITESVRFMTLLQYILFGGEYKYNFWLRTCSYTKTNPLLKYTIFPFARLMLNHLMYKFGIRIQYLSDIGSGLYIGHFGGINVSGYSVIGKNLNISQQVTIGMANRGKNKGYPTIGDNVYIGAGARIIGAVKIGNDVAIGANCVVTKDIPNNSVVVGIPAKIISNKGSKRYIERTDYESKIS